MEARNYVILQLVCWLHAYRELLGYDSSTHLQPQGRKQCAWKNKTRYAMCSNFEMKDAV